MKTNDEDGDEDEEAILWCSPRLRLGFSLFSLDPLGSDQRFLSSRLSEGYTQCFLADG